MVALQDVLYPRTAIVLRFEPIAATIACEDGVDGYSLQTIHFPIRLLPHQAITTNRGRSLAATEWGLSLRAADIKHEPTPLGGIGAINYYGETDEMEEVCDAWAAIDSRNFNLLLQQVLSGSLPEEISLSVAGMEYGEDLDGREKTWDVAGRSSVPIEKLTFGLPFVHAEQPSHEVEDIVPPTPPSNADVDAIRDDLAQVSFRIEWRLLLVIVALAVLAAIILLK